MARRIAGRGVAFPRAARRATDWAIRLASTAEITIPASSKILLAATALGGLSEISPATLIRTRGIFSVASDQFTGTEIQSGSLGLALVSNAQGALGITALPSPETDALWDGWFWIQAFRQVMRFGSAIGFEGDWTHPYEIDSKAMRKIEDDQVLVLVGENNHASNGLNVQFNTRHLIKAG